MSNTPCNCGPVDLSSNRSLLEDIMTDIHTSITAAATSEDVPLTCVAGTECTNTAKVTSCLASLAFISGIFPSHCVPACTPVSDITQVTIIAPNGVTIYPKRFQNAVKYFGELLPTGSVSGYYDFVFNTLSDTLNKNGREAVFYIVGAAIVQSAIFFLLLCFILPIYGVIDWAMAFVLMILALEVTVIAFVIALTEVGIAGTNIENDLAGVFGPVLTNIECALAGALCCYSVGEKTDPISGDILPCCCPRVGSGAKCGNSTG